MSNVPELKRGKSGFQVIDNAEDLEEKIIKICVKLPKRYTDLLLIKVIDLAGDVATYVRVANSNFPRNQHEAQIRRNDFVRAYGFAQALSGKINHLLLIPSVLRYKAGDKEKGVTINELNEISDMVKLELSLIKGSLESDKKRFKDLPN